jgi:hypothetical protein
MDERSDQEDLTCGEWIGKQKALNFFWINGSMKLESMKQGKETETEQNFRIFFFISVLFYSRCRQKKEKKLLLE